MALLLFAGCSTMTVPPLTTGSADSYAQHQQKDGLVIGVQPMTDKKQVEDEFKVNLLEHGLMPILLVVENQNPASSFIVAKENVAVLNGITGTTNTAPVDKTAQRAQVASGATSAGQATGDAAIGVMSVAIAIPGADVLAVPLIIASAKLSSDATVVQYGLADKEFYSRTLGPGEKAYGFLYLQFPKVSPPSGEYHVIAKVKNAATRDETAFDFPVNLTAAK